LVLFGSSLFGLFGFINMGILGALVVLCGLWCNGVFPVSWIQGHPKWKFRPLNTLGWNLRFSLSDISMDYREIQEVQRVLRIHEESIQRNSTSLFSVTIKVYMKTSPSSQNAIIMNTLV